MNTGVLDRPIFPCASHAALHFVADQHDAVLVANAAEFLHELGRRGDVTAFTLYRLNKNRGDFFRREHRLEQTVFDIARAIQCEIGIAFAEAIHIGILNVCHSRRRWSETTALLRLGRSQRERSHGTSVERAEECDHVLAFGVVACQLQRALDGFGTGVAIVDFMRPGHGSDL